MSVGGLGPYRGDRGRYACPPDHEEVGLACSREARGGQEVSGGVVAEAVLGGDQCLARWVWPDGLFARGKEVCGL